MRVHKYLCLLERISSNQPGNRGDRDSQCAMGPSDWPKTLVYGDSLPSKRYDSEAAIHRKNRRKSPSHLFYPLRWPPRTSQLYIYVHNKIELAMPDKSPTETLLFVEEVEGGHEIVRSKAPTMSSCVGNSSRTILLRQRANLFKLRRSCFIAPLKQCRFGRRQQSA